MRTMRVVSVALSLMAAGSLVASLSCQPQQSATPAPAAMDTLQRGEYLVTIAGCNDCHTPGYLYGAPDMSRMLSGSEVGWTGPWGIAFAANLTPDPATGLGGWSDDDIITVLRTGQRPDGRMLAPIMPYQNFSKLTDEDVRAIVAYLRSLPPVVHEEPSPVPPGGPFTGAAIAMPPPPAWDAPPPTP
jgi:mono/diheme cytochrome c family protein